MLSLTKRMALVPFRVSAAAADQTFEHRLFQIGQHTIRIDQDTHNSGSLRCIGNHRETDATSGPDENKEHLEHVGLVVWQSAFVLAEYLLRKPPFGQWHDVHAVDLGAGTGEPFWSLHALQVIPVAPNMFASKHRKFLNTLLKAEVRWVTGIALAMAGAQVTLTDLPHITHLTRRNLETNLGNNQSHAKVVDHDWGKDVTAMLPAPDLITGADVVYQQEHFDALITTLQDLAAPHTIIFLAFKLRGRGEESFKRKLEASNFDVQRVPCLQLHDEYSDGQYEVIRACKLGA